MKKIKLARLRRKLTAELVSQRAGISRATLWSVESGNPSVSFGSYVAVLCALGLQNDILLLARDDVLGRTYQDLELLPKKRISNKKRKMKMKTEVSILVYAGWFEQEHLIGTLYS